MVRSRNGSLSRNGLRAGDGAIRAAGQSRRGIGN